jgi:hypothetical protein
MKNTRRHLLLLALGLGLPLGSCQCECVCHPDRRDRRPVEPERREQPEPDAVAACLPQDRWQPPCTELCLETRRVSAKPVEGECKPEDGWSSSRIDVGGGKGFCVYDWIAAQPEALDAVEAVHAGHGGWPGQPPDRLPPATEPDCRVEPSAPDRTDALVTEFGARRTTVEQHGTIVGSDAAATHPVMVAVVDTAPRRRASARGAHGRAMASIVMDVACGSTASCPRTVETFLGLPRRVGSPDYHEDGGFYGYQSDLAEGIAAAVAEWTARADQPKLVINLSVGWEPACGGASEIVRHAIAAATEQGALVLAAAGNRRIGSCVTGPTEPGAWAAQRTSAGRETSALLHAITPVDDRLADLVTSRPGSNMRVATHAFMITTTDEGAVLGPYSGSSVATAVASGIAALVWSRRPELDAQKVMELVWQSGAVRPADPSTPSSPSVLADVYPPGTLERDQHVVTACKALELAACWGTSTPCPSLACAMPTSEVGRTWTKVWGDRGAEPLEIAPQSTSEPSDCPTCIGTVPTTVVGAPGATTLLDPWVVPQPDDPPCPVCGLKVKPPAPGSSGSGSAYLSRAAAYAEPPSGTFTLVGTTITRWNAAGGSEASYYPAAVLPLPNGVEQVITDAGFWDVDGSVTTRAYVSMTFIEGTTTFVVGNEIPVISQ